MKTYNYIILHLRILIALVFLSSVIGCINKESNTVTDIDGNIYNTIKIGNQVWMAENLKVTRFRNGDPIPNISNNKDWWNTYKGAYCNYNNSDSLGMVYGRLYNWYALHDKRGIAPKGWHIPTFSEIRMLLDSLGSENLAAGKMKETGIEHWLIPNMATNESGFTALPGGYRNGQDGKFYTLGSNGYWWSRMASYEMYAWNDRIFYFFASVNRDEKYMKYGFSVRCVKD